MSLTLVFGGTMISGISEEGGSTKNPYVSTSFSMITVIQNNSFLLDCVSRTSNIGLELCRLLVTSPLTDTVLYMFVKLLCA